MFQADAYVIADMGNPAAGVPAVTTTLRGNVIVVVKVRSLHHPAHSGLFGGAAPDALLALIRILASLHDDSGDTIVPGLAKFEWSGSEMDPDAFRKAAGMVDGAAAHRIGHGRRPPLVPPRGIGHRDRRPLGQGRRQCGDSGGGGQDLHADPSRRRLRK